MAEHIKTIQEREFVVKQQQQLMPTTLGIALISGWSVGCIYNFYILYLLFLNFIKNEQYAIRLRLYGVGDQPVQTGSAP